MLFKESFKITLANLLNTYNINYTNVCDILYKLSIHLHFFIVYMVHTDIDAYMIGNRLFRNKKFNCEYYYIIVQELINSLIIMLIKITYI